MYCHGMNCGLAIDCGVFGTGANLAKTCFYRDISQRYFNVCIAAMLTASMLMMAAVHFFRVHFRRVSQSQLFMRGSRKCSVSSSTSSAACSVRSNNSTASVLFSPSILFRKQNPLSAPPSGETECMVDAAGRRGASHCHNCRS